MDDAVIDEALMAASAAHKVYDEAKGRLQGAQRAHDAAYRAWVEAWDAYERLEAEQKTSGA